MNSRKKSILIYLGGIITGIILTFAFFFFVALGNTNGTPSDKGFMFLTSLPLIDVFIADILWRKSSDLNFIPFFVRNRFAK